MEDVRRARYRRWFPPRPVLPASKKATLLAGCATLVLAVTACSSSSTSGSATATPAASQAAASGTSSGGAQAASGSPITIQMPNLQGSTQGLNLPAVSQAGQAAVDYINANGGVHGRQLELNVCNLLTTPASDVACANSMVAAKPVAIAGGAVDNGDPIASAAAAAGIPYVVGTASSPLEQTSTDVFAVTAGDTGSYSAVGAEEQKLGGKQVTIVLVAIGSGAVAGTQKKAGPIFAEYGIKVKVIVVAPGTADLAPTLQAAAGSGTTGVFLNVDPTTCLSALNAKSTLGISSSIRFYVDLACDESSVLKGAGANANGTYIIEPTDIANTQDPDTSIYLAAMSKYEPGVSHSGYAQEGFTTVMDLYRVMKTIPAGTAITAASVQAAMQAAKNVPEFMGDGATFTCDRKILPSEPTICGNTTYIAQYTTAGGEKYIGSTKFKGD